MKRAKALILRKVETMNLRACKKCDASVSSYVCPACGTPRYKWWTVALTVLALVFLVWMANLFISRMQ